MADFDPDAYLRAAPFDPDAYLKASSKPGVAEDVAKSAGIGLAKGPIDAAGLPGDLQSAASSSYNPFNWLSDKYKEAYPERAAANAKNAERAGLGEGVTGETRLPTSSQIQKAVESKTGDFYQPQTTAGKYSQAIGEGLGNPLTYAGGGTAALKLGGSLLSSAGGEAAGQAAEGTKYETAAKLGGALLGGATAVKTLGPTIEKAAIPAQAELKAAANRGYTAARDSGLELHPQGVSDFASKVEQDLVNTHAHTGGEYGTAPKTIAVLDSLQHPPSGATITAANIDTVRKNLGRIAGETKDFRPTPDAHAASVALGHLKEYTENIPGNHILAGDAEAYVRATKQANGDYAALSNSRTIDTKLTRAENNAQGGIATAPDNQIKSQLRQILNNPKAQRGFSPDEMAQMQKVNDGTFTSNTLRQLGRGGTGVIPMIAHLGVGAPLAAATGGTSLLAQALLAGGLYGAKKTSEGMTKGQANKLDEMVRMRSPEYQARAAAVPAYDSMPNRAALARALLAH